MQRNKWTLALTSALALSATAVAGPINLLGNASFEDPFAPDGPPFVGNWEPFSGGAGSFSVQGSLMPRTGVAHLQLGITNTDNTFAGAFQDVEGLSGGEMTTFSLWHMTPSNPLDVGVEIRIEWRDSNSNTEIGRTPNLTTAPGAAYSQIILNEMVPAGADTARLVYAIQTFGGDGPSNTGEVYIDDASFVPEPTSLTLLGLAAGLLIRRR